MTLSVTLPLILLGVAAWLVPWLLGRLLPEGLGWLIAIGLLSAVILAVLAAIGFVVLYGDAGETVWQEAPWHFALLSARSAIVWAPILVLSVANQPKHWKDVEW